MMITKRYDDEQLALKKKISALQAEIDAEERQKYSATSFLRMVKKYTEVVCCKGCFREGTTTTWQPARLRYIRAIAERR